MPIIAQGAEATISVKNNVIVKDRIKKTYRHPILDTMLRTQRTRHEARILQKLAEHHFPAPRVFGVSESTLELERINGKLVRDIFDDNYKKLAPQIGTRLAELHSFNIIHGDLTTSNMILAGKLYFIDFGLSFVSLKVEDKAVDLHLLERALESRHYTVYPACMALVFKAYKNAFKGSAAVLKRYDIVKKRGRYKMKY